MPAIDPSSVITTAFLATSLDGFIARTDGSLDWLPEERDEAGEDYGYRAFIDSVDVLVMGRHTYAMALSFPTWPYGDKPVVVLVSRPVAIPVALAGSVSHLSGPPSEVVERLAARGFRHLYVDGGKTVQRFLRAGLLNHLVITRVPVLLGDGIALFGSLPGDVRLRHVDTRAFDDGLVQSRYEVVREARPQSATTPS